MHMIAVLVRRGYERTESFSHWYRVRSLDQAIPQDVAPSGYTLRCADPSDASAIAEVNNRSGAGPALTVESCRALMGAPTYRPRSPSRRRRLAMESEVAAFCIVWYDEANLAGLFEPVACHPAHHRRGLASALMREGLRRLRTSRRRAGARLHGRR